MRKGTFPSMIGSPDTYSGLAQLYRDVTPRSTGIRKMAQIQILEMKRKFWDMVMKMKRYIWKPMTLLLIQSITEL